MTLFSYEQEQTTSDDYADAAVPLPSSFKFDGGSIFIGTMLWAYGDWAVAAIGRIGHVR